MAPGSQDIVYRRGLMAQVGIFPGLPRLMCPGEVRVTEQGPEQGPVKQEFQSRGLSYLDLRAILRSDLQAGLGLPPSDTTINAPGNKLVLYANSIQNYTIHTNSIITAVWKPR